MFLVHHTFYSRFNCRNTKDFLRNKKTKGIRFFIDLKGYEAVFIGRNEFAIQVKYICLYTSFRLDFLRWRLDLLGMAVSCNIGEMYVLNSLE